MSNTRSPNHPFAFDGHFEPLSESLAESVRGNLYGYVKTQSFIQAGGSSDEKNEDFEVQLYIFISGKIIALNDGSMPTLTYYQDSVTQTGSTSPNRPDFTSKTTIHSLGMVTGRREVVLSGADTSTRLEVIVAHCDWDSEERCHQCFNVKYIIPGSKNMVKTHTLYQIGREVNIIGRLVDFDMEESMAVVLVSSVSVTTGHQLGRAVPASSSPNKGGPSGGRKLTTFSAKKPDNVTDETPPSTSQSPTPHPTVYKKATIIKNPPTTSAKGKQKLIEESDQELDKASNKDDETNEDANDKPDTLAPAKKGRPRKEILRDAAKCMKKF
ncbi:hypothetical protein PTTG_07634 [Puccinia triticina 1-1 BBBD Race 1]|uniref:Uncharacterized protein n=1 Tax=Puccinia triticina (isolate 1-1 / race 1 (BBBD)) TaxID=630390 RepID=A0A0C4F3F5_PUCT1|nr:hypothetical protein PTTG_07634 [Puccinia triticina 1-1 BBBD Race 1]